MARIVGGICLLLVTFALGVASWGLYDAGQPGAPLFADDRNDYGIDAGVTLYVPIQARIQKTSTKVNFVKTGMGTRQDIEIAIYGGRQPETSSPTVIVLEFREGARVDPKTVRSLASDPHVDIIDARNGNQYLFFNFELDPGLLYYKIQISGEMVIPALAEENSKSAFVSPKYGEKKACASVLDGPAAEILQEAQGGTWTDELQDTSTCSSIAVRSTDSVSIAVDGLTRYATRIDYSSPGPDNDSDTLMFSTETASSGEEPSKGFRARASYVDINGEARVQRMFFLSGIAVGLATALGPGAISLLYNSVTAKNSLGRRVAR